MPLEQVFTTSETRKRWSREATARGLTLDEYVATLQPPGDSPRENGGRAPSPAPSSEDRRQRRREQMDEMQEMAMSRWMMGGGGPVPVMDGGSNPGMQDVLDRLERIEDRVERRRDGGGDDDFNLDGIMRSALRYRVIAPIIRSFDSDDGSEKGGNLSRQIEKELRDRMENQQEKMLGELRARDKEFADLKDKSNEQRIGDLRNNVEALENRIADLTDQLTRGPPAQQGNVADQLTTALNQASAVSSALEALARSKGPQPPTKGEGDIIHTVAYLANELASAVGKGLEAVARVNASNRGQNPDLVGRMPPPGSPPPVYQPAYAGQPPAPAPAPRAPAPRPARPPLPQRSGLQTGAPSSGAQMPAGSKLYFEGARAAPTIAAPAAQAPPEPVAPPAPMDLPPLPPLDPSVTEFVGPDGQEIPREQYEALRQAIYERTGNDPAQVFDKTATPPPAAPPAPAAPPPEAPAGDTEPTDGAGTGDADPAEGQS
jgi:archaellum component FlaC